jgi:hypothetical protein
LFVLCKDEILWFEGILPSMHNGERRMILKWLFRKFWENAPRHHETVWSSFHEEDGIEIIAHELRRIADYLEGEE